MPNNSNFIDIGIDDGKVSEKKEGPSEEAQKQVRDSQKKAQKVQKQIKDDAHKNNLISEMLRIILLKITDEKIIKLLVFFISDYSIEIKDIFIILFPFIKDKVEGNLSEMMQDYYKYEINSLVEYSNYIKDTSFENLTIIPKEIFVDFIVKLSFYFNIGDINNNIDNIQDGIDLENQLKTSFNKEFYI